MSERRLVDLSVAEFVEAVASTDQPAPAAGSVSALTGAACAALLELVCGVLERHTPASMLSQIEAARGLRRELLELIDEDAAAVEAWLAAPRRSEAREEAGRTASAVPLRIARICAEVAELARRLEADVEGGMHFDVRSARTLATAAAEAALDLVEANLSAERHANTRAELAQEVAQLRAQLGRRS